MCQLPRHLLTDQFCFQRASLLLLLPPVNPRRESPEGKSPCLLSSSLALMRASYFPPSLFSSPTFLSPRAHTTSLLSIHSCARRSCSAGQSLYTFTARAGEEGGGREEQYEEEREREKPRQRSVSQSASDTVQGVLLLLLL